MFGLNKPPPLESEDIRRLARLEGSIESLRFEWSNVKDELLKLARRLEKRDERAEKKAREAVEIEQNDIIEETTSPVDEITARVLARRNSRAVHGPS